jgi:hypothetical protein
VADITNFSDVYLGPAATDPATRNDSSALQAGDLYFNTVDDAIKVYTGSAWVTAYITADGFVTVADAQTITGVKTFDNGLATDTISEETSAAGVTIDGVLLKDSEVTTDVINEKTSATGVTIDGVLLKDSQVTTDQINEKTSAAGVTIDSVLLKDGTVKATTTIGVGNATPAASGAGITFPATQSASSNANTLDDYEEGTFTPVLAFGGASVALTYNGRDGYYTKIGDTVTITGWIYVDSKGTSTGSATIDGLPFTAASKRQSVLISRMSDFTFSGQLSARLEAGTAIELLETTGAGVISAITNADFNTLSLCYFSGTYFVD